MNLRKLLLFFLVFVFNYVGFAQKKQAYQLFKANGKKTTYKRMLKNTAKAEVVLFGEFHNNPISHWLQFELTQDLYQQGIPLSLGAEMFEADNQEALNNYLNGDIDAKQFSKEARLWSNYTTDYQPIVEFAKEHQIAFTATNIPRRYASKVFKEGGFSALDSLSKQEKSWMPPLPIPFDIELKTYQDMLSMMGDHATEDIVKAQAIKDATMAYFILKNLKENTLIIHLNGAYHSNYGEGIVWYLNHYQNELNILTITTVEQEDISKLDEMHKDIADFVICVPLTMTKTY